jgi:hypothetical protein
MFAGSRSERQDLPELISYRVQLRSGQFAHLAGDHVVLNGSDDACDDRRVRKAGFAPGPDLVVSDQESPDIARDGSQDRLSPALSITIGSHDETGPLFHAFFVCKDKLDENDIAATKACRMRCPWGCSKGLPTPGRHVR